MADLKHILHQARRREFADRAIRRGGWGLLLGATVGAIVLLLQRMGHLGIPPITLLLVPLAGLIAGVAHAAFNPMPTAETAVRLDRSLRLKDRIGSAQLLAERRALHIDEGFAALLREDAERLAASIDVRPATPIRITGVWGAAAALSALLWIGAAYLPVMTWGTARGSTAPTPEQIAQLQPQVQQVVQTIEQSMRDVPRDDPALDEQTRRDLAALDKIAEQLGGKAQTPDDVSKARDETAARMNELADRLAEQSQRDLAAGDDLARKFSGMDSTGAPKPPMSAEEFQQALKRGDFGAAGAELQKLLDHSRDLSPNEKQAVADHLRDTASRMNDAGRADDREAGDRQKEIDQTLRDQGLTPEQIGELQRMLKENPPSPEDLRQALEKENIDPETAEKLARDLKEMQDQQRTDEQVQHDLKDVSHSLEESADQIEHPPAQPPRAENTTQPQSSPIRPPAPPPDNSSPPATSPAPQTEQDHQQPPASNPQQPNPTQRDQSNPPKAEDRQPSKDNQSSQDASKQQPDSSSKQQQQQGRDQSAQSQPGAQSSSTTDQGKQQPQSQPSQQQQQQQQGAERESGTQQQQQQQRSQQGTQSRESTQSAQTKPSDQQSNQTQPNQQQQQRQAQPATSPSEQSQPAAQPKPGAQSNPPDQSQTGQDNQQQQQQQQQSADQQPQQGGKPQPRAAQSTSSESKDQQQQQQQQTSDQKQPGAERVGDSEKSTPPQSPADALKRLAERQSTAQDRQQISEQMRQRARELAQRMTPEERERWAREWQKQNAGAPPSDADSSRQPNQPPQMANSTGRDAGQQPSPTTPESNPPRMADAQPHDVDIRGDELADKPLTDFLDNNPNAPAADGTARTSRASADDRIRRAQEVAERAVNDSAVPSRYHQFIKRVFGNLNKTIREPAPTPTTQPGP